MRDDCGTPVPKDDRIEPGPLQKNDGSSPGDLPVESPSRVDSNDKGGELETPYASVCFNKGMLLQVHAQMDFFCFVEGGMLTVWEQRRLTRESFTCIKRKTPRSWSRGESEANLSISF
ncbi:uncharacterized protein LOC141661457 isoform X4 [Apium graveolens]|uniref:uncharacterized protein LOC141661457 isoform X4 n=1 Tax=Apium graveolens TaxID=4045 RepID=UPI003D79CB5B